MHVIFISIELIHHRRHHGLQYKERRFYTLCMGAINNNTKVHKNSQSRHQIWEERQCTCNAKLWHVQIFASRFFPFIWQGSVRKLHNQLLDTLLSSSSSTTTKTIKGTDRYYKSCPGKETVNFLLYFLTAYGVVSSTHWSKYTCVWRNIVVPWILHAFLP